MLNKLTTPAVASIAAVGGVAIVNWAGATVPTIEADETYLGSVSALAGLSASVHYTQIYLVPSGKNFALTDLTVANLVNTTQTASLFKAQPGHLCTEGGNPVVATMHVTADQVVHMSYEAGPRFFSSVRLCVYGTAEQNWQINGVLLSPAPPA